MPTSAENREGKTQSEISSGVACGGGGSRVAGVQTTTTDDSSFGKANGTVARQEEQQPSKKHCHAGAFATPLAFSAARAAEVPKVDGEDPELEAALAASVVQEQQEIAKKTAQEVKFQRELAEAKKESHLKSETEKEEDVAMQKKSESMLNELRAKCADRFHIIHVPGDGKCICRTLEIHAEREGDVRDAGWLHELVIEKLIEDKNGRYSENFGNQEVKIDGETQSEDYRTHVSRISKPSEMWERTAILAAADVLQTNIVVKSVLRLGSVITETFEALDEHDTGECYLMLHLVNEIGPPHCEPIIRTPCPNGTRVEMHSLKDELENLNGLQGIISRYDATSKRYLFVANNGQEYSVNSRNLSELIDNAQVSQYQSHPAIASAFVDMKK